MSTNHQAEVLTSPKWVRTFLGGQAVADSRHAKLLRASGQIAIYYFPAADVHMEYLEQVASDAPVADLGEGPWPDPPKQKNVYTVRVNGEVAKNAAWQVQHSEAHPELVDHVAFAWPSMDAWYEEDEQVRFHPHDPYHLLDVRASSRHVQVILHGRILADSQRPVLLFETGLPVRYYLPKVDVRMDLLTLSDRNTHCAYKGIATYYSANLDSDETVENVAWYYPFPNFQYAPIQNLVAFAPKRVDSFTVDGEELSD
ncbi:MAG: DUF427 domain-containing protein [Ardenticatenaceae bacterium]|nr:DUF427 domain-containing protein [Ardenticatenaceae bacterium]